MLFGEKYSLPSSQNDYSKKWYEKKSWEMTSLYTQQEWLLFLLLSFQLFFYCILNEMLIFCVPESNI
jgi:hypothetical protein